ncbi:MAG: type I pullulanase [Flavobacteriales bacterium]|nr:type I pullulanase [Flavobacteriales bacterium]
MEYTNTKKYDSYDDYPVYDGNDLGVTYTPEKTVVKLWSPEAEEVVLRAYELPYGGAMWKKENLHLTKNGVWEAELQGDWKNTYYTLQIKYNGEWLSEQPDPYAKAVGTNGMRGMIIDFKDTNPENWNEDKKPELKSYNDIILYEAHIRDFSIHKNSGMRFKGKYIAFTESGTKNFQGKATGVDHLKEMGITHIHLLPSFDFKSIDEKIPNNKEYNWGYDPQNYNVPEGTYATNADDGRVRILEYKEMVEALHKNGIRVIMDVVYNHTGHTKESVFNQLVPGYYYRQWENGKFSDASACGNEIASDRPMVRKYIVESVKYWANEYHLDGFRFDLMAIHDIETMNQVASELRKINPTIFVYGEGWTAGDSPLPVEQRALKQNAKKLENVSVFSDDIRDGIKGHWSDVHEKGFVSGNPNLKEVVKFGIVASTNHPQVILGTHDSYAKEPYAKKPSDVIGYVSCHDNNTLYDKLKIANPHASEESIREMDKLASTIILTSQSVPFLHMGVEMKRTKDGVENSYKSPDSINQINWDWKDENYGLVQYYKGLIQLRKNHPAFKMPTEKMIAKHLKFLPTDHPNLIAYKLTDNANGDSWKNIMVFHNGSSKEQTYPIKGTWKVALNKNTIDLKGFETISKSVAIAPYSSVILFSN